MKLNLGGNTHAVVYFLLCNNASEWNIKTVPLFDFHELVDFKNILSMKSKTNKQQPTNKQTKQQLKTMYKQKKLFTKDCHLLQFEGLFTLHPLIHLTYTEILSSTRDCARSLGTKMDMTKSLLLEEK